MNKIKNKKIKPNTDQNTTIPYHNCLKLSCLNGACGFLFLFLPQIGLSVSPPPFFAFLLSPLILVLSLLELSLSLDFAQTQTQTHMPQAPLSNQWASLFGIFFVGFCAYGVANLLW